MTKKQVAEGSVHLTYTSISLKQVGTGTQAGQGPGRSWRQGLIAEAMREAASHGLLTKPASIPTKSLSHRDQATCHTISKYKSGTQAPATRTPRLSY